MVRNLYIVQRIGCSEGRLYLRSRLYVSRRPIHDDLSDFTEYKCNPRVEICQLADYYRGNLKIETLYLDHSHLLVVTIMSNSIL